MSTTLFRFAAADDLEVVAVALDEYFDEHEARAEGYGDRYRQLWADARRAAAGGKRVRPALLLGSYRALGGGSGSSSGSAGGGDSAEPGVAVAVQVATAFELLHTSFLLHDDVIDRDLVRRGRPNLAGSRAIQAVDLGTTDVAAEQWGQASAILAGDLLLHDAQSLIGALDVSAELRRRLLDLLDRAVFATAAGELADVAFGTGVEHAELADALAMTELKTAGYSFEAPLAAGAVLAGAAPDVVEALEGIGRSIGVAFQLRDDLLGVFGRQELTGKSTRSDLDGRKLTPLMAYGLASSHGPALGALLAHAPLDDESADRVRAILVESGARAYVEQLIDENVRRAIQQAELAPIPRRLRGELRLAALEAGERER